MESIADLQEFLLQPQLLSDPAQHEFLPMF